MSHKELKNIAKDEKVSVRSVQRIYKNLNIIDIHITFLPSQVSQGRPRRFTSEIEKVIL